MLGEMAPVVRLLAVCLAALSLVACASAKAARIPAGVTSVRIRSAAGVTNVTRPADVQRIVRWFDALPRFVALPCPLELYTPPDVSFTFLGADGVLRRAVDHAPGTCGSEVVSGRERLADDGFAASVSRLLGVSFDPNARTEQNAAAAKLDAQMLVARVRVPSGGEPIAASPTSRTWRVHLPLAEVFAWEQAHRPRGAAEDGSGTGARWGVITDRELMFDYPPIADRISERSLDIEMIVKPGGWTRIHAYAADTPIVARSPNEKVPAGVKQILFRRRLITNAAEIGRIVRRFDALPIVQPGSTFSCPLLVYGPVVQLEFRRASGEVLASARLAGHFAGGGLDSTSCTPIEFTIGDHPQAPLVGGDFLGWVARNAR